FSDTIDDAVEIIKWFNSHSVALGLFQDVQRGHFPNILALILPALTRWTTHYQAISRMNHLRLAFIILLARPDAEKDLLVCAGEKPDAIAKAKEVLAKLKAPGFFDKLSHIQEHLAPLAAATNILQSDHCRLDTVLITLANLVRKFSSGRLEKCWAKQDQDFFILAIILNPWIRVSAFAKDSKYRRGIEVVKLACNVYRRLFQRDPDTEFELAVTAYIHRDGRWSDKEMRLARYMPLGGNPATVDLVHVWKTQLTVQDPVVASVDSAPSAPNGAEGFAYLAACIASITPNTASTERIFSQFKVFHTPHRNRLSHHVVRKMTVVKHDTQKRYPVPPSTNKRKHDGTQSSYTPDSQ
ncbi:ribonuclease H-like domain-containing protein, partial [Vararia minispora EC-137]